MIWKETLQCKYEHSDHRNNWQWCHIFHEEPQVFNFDFFKANDGILGIRPKLPIHTEFFSTKKAPHIGEDRKSLLWFQKGKENKHFYVEKCKPLKKVSFIQGWFSPHDCIENVTMDTDSIIFVFF